MTDEVRRGEHRRLACGLRRLAANTGRPLACVPRKTRGLACLQKARPDARCSRRVAGNRRRVACAPLAALSRARLKTSPALHVCALPCTDVG